MQDNLEPQLVQKKHWCQNSFAGTDLPDSAPWRWPFETLDGCTLWAPIHDSHSSCDPLTSKTLVSSWAWLKRSDFEQAHNSHTGSLAQDINPNSPHPWHIRCSPALPSASVSYCQVSAFSPIEKSQQLISWHHWLGKVSPEEAEVGSVGKAGPPRLAGAVHLIQFTQSIWSKREYMPNRSKCPGIFVSQHLLSTCLHLPFSTHTAWTHHHLAAAITWQQLPQAL